MYVLWCSNTSLLPTALLWPPDTSVHLTTTWHSTTIFHLVHRMQSFWFEPLPCPSSQIHSRSFPPPDFAILLNETSIYLPVMEFLIPFYHQSCWSVNVSRKSPASLHLYGCPRHHFQSGLWRESLDFSAHSLLITQEWIFPHREIRKTFTNCNPDHIIPLLRTITVLCSMENITHFIGENKITTLHVFY